MIFQPFVFTRIWCRCLEVEGVGGGGGVKKRQMQACVFFICEKRDPFQGYWTIVLKLDWRPPHRSNQRHLSLCSKQQANKWATFHMAPNFIIRGLDPPPPHPTSTSFGKHATTSILYRAKDKTIRSARAWTFTHQQGRNLCCLRKLIFAVWRCPTWAVG